jgi:hypothetical protein
MSKITETVMALKKKHGFGHGLSFAEKTKIEAKQIKELNVIFKLKLLTELEYKKVLKYIVTIPQAPTNYI